MLAIWSKSNALHIKDIKRAVQHVFTPVNQNRPVMVAKVVVALNTLFSPFQLVQAHELKQMSDKNKARKKEADKAMAKEAKEAKRAALTCAVEGHNKRTRKEGGAKSWRQCFVCSKLYCKNHRAEFNACVLVCNAEDVVGKAVNVAAV